MPLPDLVSAPLPESVPDSVSVVPAEGVIALVPLSVTSRADVKLAVVASVPPPSVSVPELSPRCASAPICSVPAETLVPPE